MNRSRNYSRFLSLGGLVSLLIITWGLDAFMEYFRRRLGQTFSLTLAYGGLWIQTLSYFLVAALLLLLFWFALTQAPRNAWVAALYILVGLFFGFFRELYFVPVIGVPLPNFFDALVSANSYTVLAGSFIAMIGVFMLMLPRREGMIAR